MKKLFLEEKDLANPSCPYCGKSLLTNKEKIDGEKTVNLKSAWGDVYLSRVWGDHKKIIPPNLPQGHVINLRCPHCGKSLNSEYRCTCGAPIVVLDEASTDAKKIGICSRNGCQHHKTEKDLPIEASPETMII